MKVFRFYILKENLDKYLDPMCIFCKRKRSEINKIVDFKGKKAWGGITILQISGVCRPVCDDCFPRTKESSFKTFFH